MERVIGVVRNGRKDCTRMILKERCVESNENGESRRRGGWEKKGMEDDRRKK